MYAQTAMNHRLGRRIPLNALVEVCTPDGRRLEGYLRDVSASGALVWTSGKVDLRSPVSIEVVDANEKFEACVTRLQPCALGVEWVNVETRALCLLLARHDAALPAPRPAALATPSGRPPLTFLPDGSVLLLA